MKARAKKSIRSFLPEMAKPAFDAGAAAAEEESPATMPESGLKNAGVGVEAPKKRPRGYQLRPKKSATPTVEEIIADVEKKGGETIPEMVMLVIRAYRSLEATNRAQREVIRGLGDRIAELKGAKKK